MFIWDEGSYALKNVQEKNILYFMCNTTVNADQEIMYGIKEHNEWCFLQLLQTDCLPLC